MNLMELMRCYGMGWQIGCKRPRRGEETTVKCPFPDASQEADYWWNGVLAAWGRRIIRRNKYRRVI